MHGMFGEVIEMGGVEYQTAVTGQGTELMRVYRRGKLSKDGPNDTEKTHPDSHG